MASVEIHRFPLGVSNCYLVKQDGLLLVDTGTPNQMDNLSTRLKGLSVSPEEISLILLTHGHHDHVGSAADLKEITGAPVAINYREREWVEEARTEIPPGIGVVGSMMALLARVRRSSLGFPACAVDMALDDGDFSLQPFGIEGRVVHTPGHTSGSMSVLLDSGDALVGDLAMSFLPFGLRSPLPLLGSDPDIVRRSWRLLLDNGARTIHPAHGRVFSADVLRKELSR